MPKQNLFLKQRAVAADVDGEGGRNEQLHMARYNHVIGD